MQNPRDLYQVHSDAIAAGHQPGVLILALGGFVDAGGVQQVLTQHLTAGADAELVATFDVDQLLDYRGRRPLMVFEVNQWVDYDQPRMELRRLRDRDGDAYYLLTGPEPDYQWERCAAALVALVRELGVTLTVSVHGIPMGVPHTRPVGMSAHATNPALIGERESPFGRVNVPGSFPALAEVRLGEAGLDAVGFAIHVPHYLAQAAWPEGALAALNAITEVTGLNLPNDDLVTAAGANAREIAAELASNDDGSAMVQALEQQYDSFLAGQERPSLLATTASDLPSADEIAEDVEDFLRSMGEDR